MTAKARWRPRATAAESPSGATDFTVTPGADNALLRPRRKSPSVTTISSDSNTPTAMPTHFRIFMAADDGALVRECKVSARPAKYRHRARASVVVHLRERQPPFRSTQESGRE